LKKYGNAEVFLTKPGVDDSHGKLKEVNNPEVYLHNSESLFRQHPKLLEKLNFGYLEDHIEKKVAFTQLFMGRKKTRAPMHNACFWNFFYMLDGKKKWSFVDPNYSVFAYPYYLMGRASGFTHCPDPNDYDKKTYPLFEYCPVYEVTLEPGDLLALPPWWWHAVENLTERSVGVATRWFGDGEKPGDFMMMEEDYDLNRLFSFLFQIGPQSYSVLHKSLRSKNKVHEKDRLTLWEKNSRYTPYQNGNKL